MVNGNKLSLAFALASVALVILVDLATGQGPPVYTNFLQAQQDYRPPPPPMRPVAIMQHAEYDPRKQLEKEYEKAIELGKKDEVKEGEEEYKKDEKEFKKEGGFFKHGDKYAGDKYGAEGATTAAPGMLSSLSNSMSGAWKSISTLGREKRSTGNEVVEKTNATVRGNPQSRSLNEKVEVAGTTASPGERSLDSYEYLQYKNQGYVYFKVPKYLVCNY